MSRQRACQSCKEAPQYQSKILVIGVFEKTAKGKEVPCLNTQVHQRSDCIFASGRGKYMARDVTILYYQEQYFCHFIQLMFAHLLPLILWDLRFPPDIQYTI